MNIEYTLNRIYNLLPHLIRRRDLIKEIERDLYRQAQGTTLYFPLDFYEIHNFLFPLAQGNRDAETVKYYFRNLPHEMVLLPPTAMEFIRYLERQSQKLRGIYHPSSTIIDEFLKSQELREFREELEKGEPEEIMRAYRKMGRYRTLIDLLRQDALQLTLEEPTQAFMQFMDTGRLAVCRREPC